MLIAVTLIALLYPFATRAQVQADTLTIHFRRDSIRIDMGFANNEECWNRFERNFNERYSHFDPAALRIDIYAGASPEGNAVYNRWLGESRGQAIRRLVRYRLGNKVGNIVVHNEAARWDSFYNLVAASNEPWRDEVLRIIEMPASADETKRDHREMRLRRLHGGKVWPILDEYYLAPLRSGGSAVISLQSNWRGRRDTIVIRDTVVVMMQNSRQRDTVVVMMPFDGHHAKPKAESESKKQRHALRDSLLQYPAWAVKTNLLLWGVVAPNVQVEIPLGRSNRWSLEAEYFVPWFIWANNSHASQFHNLGLELRLWLGNRLRHPWLQGFHIGLAGAVGYYDWEWKRSEGYQGEYVNTYLNLGFQHRWGRHWAIDMGLGIGLMATRYRHYYGGSVYPENHLEPWDEHLIWHDTGHFLWPGPCHANVSLVYLFNAWPFHTQSRKLHDKR